MAYEYITKYTAKNYTPKAQVGAVFGYRREIDFVTIHHWGAMESGYRPGRFYEICEYLASANSRMVSAHYVVERGKVACLINPEDASWANGNAKGNALSVTIECNPLASSEDKATVAELLAELRAAYPGKQVVVGHNYWTPTECPGLYNVFELDRLALDIEHGKKKPNKGKQATVKPAADEKKKLEKAMATLDKEDLDRIAFAVWSYDQDGKTRQAWWHQRNVAEQVLNHPVKLRGTTSGKTDLETKVAWQAHEFHDVKDAVTALSAQVAALTELITNSTEEEPTDGSLGTTGTP